MLSSNQWGLGGENCGRCAACLEDKLGRFKAGPGRSTEAVQVKTGRNGQVEGMSTSFSPGFTCKLLPYVAKIVVDILLLQKKNNIQVVQN
jgi:hypothetical protein